MILTDPPGHAVSMKQLLKAIQTLVPLRQKAAATWGTLAARRFAPQLRGTQSCFCCKTC